ncbi:MAG: tRNA (N6-isopentenyl adenosine(37)-C2)-methylthiotransferase MiaB [Patescibacteria group bacterium]
MKYLIKTYGCQFNYSDSERIAAVLEGIGFAPAKGDEDANLVVFNTCSIKQKAEDKVFGRLVKFEQMKRKKKNLIVALTGCMVRKTSTKKSPALEQDKLVKNLVPVDFVFRIEDCANLPELIKEIAPQFKLRGALDEIDSGSLKNYFKIIPKYNSRFQAFVPIASGCDKFCAYCIVPYTRGRERSRPMKEILTECKKLVEDGCKEITLLGQNVDSYGLSFLDRKEKRFKALKPGGKIYFTKLLEAVDKLKTRGLCRVRWTSPHPRDMTDDLISAVKTLKTQMPYIHLPVQAGSDNTLRRMNRPYTVEHYVGLIKKIRKVMPDCSISTDIIVGFCGETKKDFNKSCALYKKIKWDMAYMSKYSMRKYTAAHKIMKDDVPEKEKERRWRALNEIIKACSLGRNRFFLGKTVNVLVERCKNGICEGMSEHSKRTQFAGSPKLIGEIVPVKVKKALEWNLVGKITK